MQQIGHLEIRNTDCKSDLVQTFIIYTFQMGLFLSSAYHFNISFTWLQIILLQHTTLCLYPHPIQHFFFFLTDHRRKNFFLWHFKNYMICYLPPTTCFSRHLLALTSPLNTQYSSAALLFVLEHRMHTLLYLCSFLNKRTSAKNNIIYIF